MRIVAPGVLPYFPTPSDDVTDGQEWADNVSADGRTARRFSAGYLRVVPEPATGTEKLEPLWAEFAVANSISTVVRATCIGFHSCQQLAVAIEHIQVLQRLHWLLGLGPRDQCTALKAGRHLSACPIGRPALATGST